MALEKRIHIDETKYFELRFEAYNTFNHTNFANPATPEFTSEDVSDPTTFGQIFLYEDLDHQWRGQSGATRS